MLEKIRIKSKYKDISDESWLYLTDDLQLLKELQKAGEKAAAVLTPENGSKDFSGIPYAVEKPEELEEEDLERLYRRLAGLPWYILETNRCRLREMTPADTDRLYEMYADPGITRYMEPLFENREEERHYIEDYRKYVYEFYGYGMWLIEDAISGQVIGRAGIEAKEEALEMGYMVAVPWQRQGIAYEVCRGILTYVQREIECERIVSRVRQDNFPSVRLLVRLGFHQLKKCGDYMIYEKII